MTELETKDCGHFFLLSACKADIWKSINIFVQLPNVIGRNKRHWRNAVASLHATPSPCEQSVHFAIALRLLYRVSDITVQNSRKFHFDVVSKFRLKFADFSKVVKLFFSQLNVMVSKIDTFSLQQRDETMTLRFSRT